MNFFLKNHIWLIAFTFKDLIVSTGPLRDKVLEDDRLTK